MNFKTTLTGALCTMYKYSGMVHLQETCRHLLGRSSMVIVLFHCVTDEVPEDRLTVSTARY